MYYKIWIYALSVNINTADLNLFQHQGKQGNPGRRKMT